MNSLEFIILSNLINNKEYFNEVISHIRSEYFDGEYKTIMNIIKKYSIDYQDMPSKEVIKVSIDNLCDADTEEYKNSVELLKSVSKPLNDMNYKWLVEETEKYCKHKAVRTALYNSIAKLKDKDKIDDNILRELEDALAVSFRNDIGYSYTDDIESRLQSYKNQIKKYSTPLSILNIVTNGGVESKTLNIVMSNTGGGKTVWLTDMAIHSIEQGLNVLYVTCEMSDLQISKRLDANVLDVSQDDLAAINIQSTLGRFDKLKSNGKGQLIIKEWPAGSITCLDIKKVIDDLQLKKKIDVDVLIVDYLNLLGSYRYSTKNSNSYQIIKAVAEELRGIAVRYDIPCWSATQSNRQAFTTDDMDLSNTSESVGVPQTADLFLAFINSEELSKDSKIMIKQLKNRYGDPNKYMRFTARIDRAKSRIYDDETFSGDVKSQVQKVMTEKFTNNNVSSSSKDDIDSLFS